MTSRPFGGEKLLTARRFESGRAVLLRAILGALVLAGVYLLLPREPPRAARPEKAAKPLLPASRASNSKRSSEGLHHGRLTPLFAAAPVERTAAQVRHMFYCTAIRQRSWASYLNVARDLGRPQQLDPIVQRDYVGIPIHLAHHQYIEDEEAFYLKAREHLGNYLASRQGSGTAPAAPQYGEVEEAISWLEKVVASLEREHGNEPGPERHDGFTDRLPPEEWLGLVHENGPEDGE